MGEFSKMLSMIGDLLNAIKDGRWSDAASIGKALLNQGSDQPDALPGVTSSAVNARGKVLGFWEEVKTRFSDGGWYQHEQKTLADRNNNPGNIRPVGGGGFVRLVLRWKAGRHEKPADALLHRKTTGRRLQTIMDIVSTWAPAGDNNDPQQYADRLLAGWAFADGSA
jgi:hypothetical protein